jgi:hypothetical protein
MEQAGKAHTGQNRQDRGDRTEQTGQSRQDRADRTAQTGQHRQRINRQEQIGSERQAWKI